MQLFARYNSLLVREFIASDRLHFSQVVMHEQCMKYCPAGKLTEQQAKSLFAVLLNQNLNDKAGLLAIEESATQTVIGFAGLQECYIEDNIDLNFVFRVLPDFFEQDSFAPLFKQLLQNLASLHQLPVMRAVVAKNNQESIAMMECLAFKPIKKIKCRGITSFLYQYPA